VVKQARSARLNDKISAMKLQMAVLKEIEAKLAATGETQISLTDPDARSMMTRGSGIVGYNVQTAVDAEHHLIVEHEVTNIGNDRDQLSGMAKKVRTAIGTESLTIERRKRQGCRQCCDYLKQALVSSFPNRCPVIHRCFDRRLAPTYCFAIHPTSNARNRVLLQRLALLPSKHGRYLCHAWFP